MRNLLEESANVAAGHPSKVSMPPAVVRLIGRFMFKRVLRKAAFPNGFYYLRLASVQFDIDAQKFYNIFTDLMTKSLQK